jgi:hypothetical protein
MIELSSGRPIPRNEDGDRVVEKSKAHTILLVLLICRHSSEADEDEISSPWRDRPEVRSGRKSKDQYVEEDHPGHRPRARPCPERRPAGIRRVGTHRQAESARIAECVPSGDAGNGRPERVVSPQKSASKAIGRRYGRVDNETSRRISRNGVRWMA